MALTAVAPLLYPAWPQLTNITNAGNNQTTSDALGEGAACVLFPPALGAIRFIGFRTGLNVSAPSLTCAIGVYAVNASGLPDTSSPFGGMSPHLKSSGWAASTYYEVQLVTDCTISDLSVPIAVGGAISAYTSGSIQFEGSTLNNQSVLPYQLRNLNGTWSKIGAGMNFMLKYSDGTVYYIPGTYLGPNGGQAALSQNNSRGLKMTVPFACRVTGCITRHHPSTFRTHRAVLYDASNNILAQAYRTNAAVNATFNGAAWSFFNPVTLTAGQVVRLVVLNDDASAMDQYTWQVPNSDCLKQMMADEGLNLQGTSRSGSGSWSDQGLTSLGCPMHSLIIDQVDVGGSGPAFAKLPISRLVGRI